MGWVQPPLHPQSPPGAFCSAVIRVQGTGVNKSARGGAGLDLPWWVHAGGGSSRPPRGFLPILCRPHAAPKPPIPLLQAFWLSCHQIQSSACATKDPYQVPTGSRQRKCLKYIFFPKAGIAQSSPPGTQVCAAPSPSKIRQGHKKYRGLQDQQLPSQWLPSHWFPSQWIPPPRCPSQRRGQPPAAFAGGVERAGAG